MKVANQGRSNVSGGQLYASPLGNWQMYSVGFFRGYPMTYRELLEKLEKLTDTQLNQLVRVYDELQGEHYPMSSLLIENTILDDPNHPLFCYSA